MTNAYEYIKKSMELTLKGRMIDWRAGESVTKIDKPTDIARARTLGYKDKKGFVVIRVRVVRGGRQRPRPRKGRRSKRMHTRLTLKMSYQWVAEGRAQKKYPNLEVLNSYQTGKDGKHYFYEVIMIDPDKPEITNDQNTSWIVRNSNKNKVFRGLTSAGKKSRGLRHRGPEIKSGPSARANERRGR
ncbi:MAG: 50S ribosomal protein L15e [Nanoarchaeota archaeon]